MDKKQLLLAIAGGIVAIALICVLLVGLINGAWPWEKNYFDNIYADKPATGQEDTTGDTQDGTTSDNVDPTETTSGVAGDETGNSNTGNSGSGTGSNTGTGNSGSGTDTKDPTVGVEVEDPTQSTESQDPTEEKKPSGVIDFQDLLDKANKGNG
jgi:hypothetical protein